MTWIFRGFFLSGITGCFIEKVSKPSSGVSKRSIPPALASLLSAFPNYLS